MMKIFGKEQKTFSYESTGAIPFGKDRNNITEGTVIVPLRRQAQVLTLRTSRHLGSDTLSPGMAEADSAIVGRQQGFLGPRAGLPRVLVPQWVLG